jgi:cell division transport system permease protein
MNNSIKISILRLHGASILYSASSILNHALLKFIFSLFYNNLHFYIMFQIIWTVLFPLELHDISRYTNKFTFIELVKIFLLSFSISTFTIFGVLLKYKITND